MALSRRSFLIRTAFEERTPEVLAFHKSHLTPYLFPRDLDYFERLAREESLYEVIETTRGTERLVGICYVTAGEEEDHTPRFEFGGVYVEGGCRGLGVATALGIVAISNHFIWNYKPGRRLIGHVHENNNKPRGILQNHLGFSHVGKETLPRHLAPPSMERNERGEVVGDLFLFGQADLDSFADWIERFDGTIEGAGGRSHLDVQLPFMRDEGMRSEAVADLHDLAGR